MKNVSSNSVKSFENDQVSLKELFHKLNDFCRFLLSKWIIIVLFGFIGLGIGIFYASIKKPTYIASTTFVLEEGDKSSPMGNLGGLASMAGIDLGSNGGGMFQGDNILQLYKSRLMIEKTLFTKVNYQGKPILLVNKFIDFNNLKESWEKDPRLKKISFSESTKLHVENSRLQDSIVGVIVSHINKDYLTVSKIDKKLSVIQAVVNAPDEFFAKNFNENIVKNVNDFYIQTKTKKSIQNVKILQHKVDSVRSVMNGAIFNSVAVLDATPNLNPTRQAQRLAPAQKSQFTAETNKLMLSTLLQNLELGKMNLLKESPLIQVIDEPIYPLAVDKTSKIKMGMLGLLLAALLAITFLTCSRLIKSLKD